MRKRDLAFCCLLAALLVACVVRDPADDLYSFRNFDPFPDAIEYTSLASNIQGGVGPYLSINGHLIPSRYTLGFPLLLVPFYRILGNDIVNAYYASLSFGVLSVLLVFWLARALSPHVGVARWCTFFYATNSLTLTFSILAMSEMCSVFLLLLVLNVAVRLDDASGAWAYAGLGSIIGLAALVRFPNGLVLAPVLVFLAAVRRVPLRLSRMVVVLLGLLPAAFVTVWYDARLFGSPWRTGYDVYVPRTYFSWEYFRANVTCYLATMLLARDGKTLWLDGPFYSVMIPVLSLFGVGCLRREGRRDLLVLVALWAATFFLLYSSYFYYDFRFFLPVLPLVFLLAAEGVHTVLAALPGRWRPLAAVFVAGAYLALPLSSGQSGLSVARRHRAAMDPPANYLHVQAVNAFMERISAQPGSHYVLTALNLVYHNYYSNKRYTLVPLSASQEYARTPEVAAVIREPRIDELLERGDAVYVSDYQVIEQDARSALEDLERRYRLEPIPEPGVHLRRLVK